MKLSKSDFYISTVMAVLGLYAVVFGVAYLSVGLNWRTERELELLVAFGIVNSVSVFTIIYCMFTMKNTLANYKIKDIERVAKEIQSHLDELPDTTECTTVEEKEVITNPNEGYYEVREEVLAAQETIQESLAKFHEYMDEQTKRVNAMIKFIEASTNLEGVEKEVPQELPVTSMDNLYEYTGEHKPSGVNTTVLAVGMGDNLVHKIESEGVRDTEETKEVGDKEVLKEEATLGSVEFVSQPVENGKEEQQKKSTPVNTNRNTLPSKKVKAKQYSRTKNKAYSKGDTKNKVKRNLPKAKYRNKR